MPLTGRLLGVISHEGVGIGTYVRVESDRGDTALIFPDGTYVMVLPPGVFTFTLFAMDIPYDSVTLTIPEGGVTYHYWSYPPYPGGGGGAGIV